MAAHYATQASNCVYYSRKVNAFLQVLDFIPEVRDGRGKLRPPSEFKSLFFRSPGAANATYCLLNSSLFRWFVDVVSDGSHLNRREIDNFPFDPDAAARRIEVFGDLAEALSDELKRRSLRRVMRYKHDTLTVQCIIPKFAKSVIDKVDRQIGRYYGFTDEELDFIINYDIKYRVGDDSDDDAPED